VWFRAATQQQARSLGLTGYAINLRDGRVEVLVCGEQQALERLEVWLWQGPELAQVNAVLSEDAEVSRSMADFTIG